VNSYLVRPHGKRLLLEISERRWEDIGMSTRVIDLNVKIKVNSVGLSTPLVETKISQVVCYLGDPGMTTREVGM
jgi:hypothetical protein